MSTTNNTFGVAFYLKKQKTTQAGKSPIYARITVNGKRIEISDELETKVTETTEIRTLENTKQLERFDKQLNGFDEKINAITKEIPVKYNIQFDTKSKFVIRTILGLGLAVAVMLAISISLWIENSRMADETSKFLILRGFYPDVAKYIDSAYTTNADFLN
jgi:hypothetical protein